MSTTATTASIVMSWPGGITSTVTFKWEVTGMKVSDEGSNSNAVVQTYWRKTGTDENGNEGKFDGATPFTSVDVPEGEFVPYDELTEEMVLSWIQPIAEEPNYRAHINDSIAAKIGVNLNIKRQVQRMPWQDPNVTPIPTVAEPARTDI